MIKLIKILFHMFFRLFFTVEYFGVENIPKSGAAVLAGNHPSYLDPALIYIVANRPVRFLAWDKLFKVPLLGSFIRLFGAMPVDVTKKDSNAFEQAMKVLEHGDLLGIFPEGGRSQQGIIESLKSGAARLAIFNKCPIVPITITGAYEAWPVWRPLPLPRKITVKFHEPIVLDPAECEERHNDPEFFREVSEVWRERVNRRLLPGLRAQEALNKHFARPATHLRIFELVPAGALIIMLFAPISRLWLTLPVLLYYSYLFLDIFVLPQGRISKIVRDFSTPVLMLAWHPILVSGVSMPKVEFLSLTVVMAGLLVPFYWTNYYDTQRFLRGLVLTYYLSLTLEIFKPSPFGLHWAFIVFAAVYSLYYQPLYWYAQLILLMLYTITLYLIMGAVVTPALIGYIVLAVVINIYMIAFKFTAHDGRTV